ncbi:SepM family pheromone-processing serine protease [Bacillus sp. NPDC077027]|uniref:SepM family pheromone-processing serine protease n=1 Tax=Bacillus sp. NPDC077027 TaxID=3390548 RepID=UPI003D04385B
MKKMNIRWMSLFVVILVLFALTFIKLPYYVTKPGEATEIAPHIKVDGGYSEKGSFSLMTIKVGPANPYTYVLAKFNKYDEIVSEDNIKADGESDEDYMKRQLQLMKSSQENAMIAAYTKAGKRVDYTFNGVYASYVMKGMPAYGEIEVGDRIKSVDGQSYESADKMVEYIGSQKVGKTVTFVLDRNGKEKSVKVKLKPFKDEPKRIGIGVSLFTDRDVKVSPKVKVDIENIGGPSAGLMMSLEIYNQLTKEDETHGYAIAGTGTIDADGTVGPIGGIDQKVVAADKAGKDIFFAPNDKGNQNSDYRNAVKTAKDINSKMKIVPVDTMQDALDYLNKLKDKK